MNSDKNEEKKYNLRNEETKYFCKRDKFKNSFARPGNSAEKNNLKLQNKMQQNCNYFSNSGINSSFLAPRARILQAKFEIRNVVKKFLLLLS